MSPPELRRIVRVLIVEDRPADTELMLAQLRKTNHEIHWNSVKEEHEFIAALEEHFDVILADYTLPAFSVLRALELLQQRRLDIPFIVVTGSLGDDAAGSQRSELS